MERAVGRLSDRLTISCFSHCIAMREENGHEVPWSRGKLLLPIWPPVESILVYALPDISKMEHGDVRRHDQSDAVESRLWKGGGRGIIVVLPFTCVFCSSVPHFWVFLQGQKQIMCFGLRLAFQLSRAVSRPFTREYHKGFLQTISCLLN